MSVVKDGLTTLQHARLNSACMPILRLFGHRPMLVGSVLTSSDFRDVDVRLILPDDEFDGLFATRDKLWEAVSLGLSSWLTLQTGLPIDFQVQRMTEANERFPGPGQRNALAMPSPFAGWGDATNFVEPSPVVAAVGLPEEGL